VAQQHQQEQQAVEMFHQHQYHREHGPNNGVHLYSYRQAGDGGDGAGGRVLYNIPDNDKAIDYKQEKKLQKAKNNEKRFRRKSAPAQHPVRPSP
jgi:hypothetical protein